MKIVFFWERLTLAKGKGVVTTPDRTDIQFMSVDFYYCIYDICIDTDVHSVVLKL